MNNSNRSVIFRNASFIISGLIGVSFIVWGIGGWTLRLMSPDGVLGGLPLDTASTYFGIGMFFFGVSLFRFIRGVVLGWFTLSLIAVSICVTLLSQGSDPLGIHDFSALFTAACFFLVPVAALVTGIQKHRPIAGFIAMIFGPIGFIVIACMGAKQCVSNRKAMA